MYEKTTINQFIKAWFNQDYSEISKDDFDFCYSEYIDTTGLYYTNEFNIICSINYLTAKINSVTLAVDLEKRFVSEFSVPYPKGLDILKKHGYKVEWKANIEKFIKDLDSVIKKHHRFTSEKLKKEKELDEERKKRGQELTPKEERVNFLKMLNTLGKIGYNIEKNETTVEELALMIRQQLDEQDAINSKLNLSNAGR